MKLQTLYKKTQQESKINDDMFLMECLEFYKTSKRAIGSLSSKGTRSSDFYDKLIKVTKNQDTSNINLESEEAFYVMMTNIWMQNIMLLTEQDIENMKKNGYPIYKEIKEIVSRVKKVNSMKEVISLYNSINKMLVDEQDMDKKRYFWRFDQEKTGTIYSREGQSGFYHIQSRYVNARKTNNIEHADYRLYINCQSEDIFELMTLYVNLCRKRQIPYYFKFGADKKRRDKFIVYCPKELLSENIEILKEIAIIRPEIPKKCGEMLSLVGNIDDWIGIASNPKTIEGKGKFSYNTMRAEILEEAAELMMIKFIERYKGKMIRYNGQTINFDMLLAKNAAQIVIEQMIKEKKIDKDDPNIQKYINEIIKNLLLRKEGISELDKAIIRIKEVMPEKNNLIASNSTPIFTIKLSNGQQFQFNLYTTDALLKSLIDVMKEVNPKYIQRYRQIIKEKCIDYQVDPENFAFNQSTKNEFKQLDEKEEKKSATQLSNNVTGRWNKRNYDFVMKILSTIPKQILMLKLENKMTLQQYFQEVVVDRMDENHNYINNDGTLIPVNKIIEDQINKVARQGNWSEKNFYYVNEIMSTLSEDILKSRISELEELNLDVILYNDITLQQYFQEVVVDRMDENQNFIRFDGSLVPVTSYILSIVNRIKEKQIDADIKGPMK